jgi:Flp pilus assembly pilin Flp
MGEDIAALVWTCDVDERREGHMLDSMQTWLGREDGQALIEYALILSLIAIVTFGALSLIGTNVIDILNGAAGSL